MEYISLKCLFVLATIIYSASAAPVNLQKAKQLKKASTAEDPYKNEPPYAYDFGYSIHGDDGFSSHQREIGDHAGRKSGSYSYQGADGLYRTVVYIADENGFRATIHTNEPGAVEQTEGHVKVSTSRKNQRFTKVNHVGEPYTPGSRRIYQRVDMNTPKL